MANGTTNSIKVTDLDAITSLSDNTIFYVVDPSLDVADQSRKINYLTFKQLVNVFRGPWNRAHTYKRGDYITIVGSVYEVLPATWTPLTDNPTMTDDNVGDFIFTSSTAHEVETHPVRLITIRAETGDSIRDKLRGLPNADKLTKFDLKDGGDLLTGTKSPVQYSPSVIFHDPNRSAGDFARPLSEVITQIEANNTLYIERQSTSFVSAANFNPLAVENVSYGNITAKALVVTYNGNLFDEQQLIKFEFIDSTGELAKEYLFPPETIKNGFDYVITDALANSSVHKKEVRVRIKYNSTTNKTKIFVHQRPVATPPPALYLFIVALYKVDALTQKGADGKDGRDGVGGSFNSGRAFPSNPADDEEFALLEDITGFKKGWYYYSQTAARWEPFAIGDGTVPVPADGSITRQKLSQAVLDIINSKEFTGYFNRTRVYDRGDIFDIQGTFIQVISLTWQASVDSPTFGDNVWRTLINNSAHRTSVRALTFTGAVYNVTKSGDKLLIDYEDGRTDAEIDIRANLTTSTGTLAGSKIAPLSIHGTNIAGGTMGEDKLLTALRQKINNPERQILDDEFNGSKIVNKTVSELKLDDAAQAKLNARAQQGVQGVFQVRLFTQITSSGAGSLATPPAKPDGNWEWHESVSALRRKSGASTADANYRLWQAQVSGITPLNGDIWVVLALWNPATGQTSAWSDPIATDPDHAQALAGIPGKDGTDGRPGNDGAQGRPGQDGEDGQDASTLFSDATDKLTDSNINDNTISGTKFKDLSIQGRKFAANSVTNSKVASGIAGSKIANMPESSLDAAARAKLNSGGGGGASVATDAQFVTGSDTLAPSVNQSKSYADSKDSFLVLWEGQFGNAGSDNVMTIGDKASVSGLNEYDSTNDRQTITKGGGAGNNTLIEWENSNIDARRVTFLSELGMNTSNWTMSAQIGYTSLAAGDNALEIQQGGWGFLCTRSSVIIGSGAYFGLSLFVGQGGTLGRPVGPREMASSQVDLRGGALAPNGNNPYIRLPYDTTKDRVILHVERIGRLFRVYSDGILRAVISLNDAQAAVVGNSGKFSYAGNPSNTPSIRYYLYKSAVGNTGLRPLSGAGSGGGGQDGEDGTDGKDGAQGIFNVRLFAHAHTGSGEPSSPDNNYEWDESGGHLDRKSGSGSDPSATVWQNSVTGLTLPHLVALRQWDPKTNRLIGSWTIYTASEDSHYYGVPAGGGGGVDFNGLTSSVALDDNDELILNKTGLLGATLTTGIVKTGSPIYYGWSKSVSNPDAGYVKGGTLSSPFGDILAIWRDGTFIFINYIQGQTFQLNNKGIIDGIEVNVERNRISTGDKWSDGNVYQLYIRNLPSQLSNFLTSSGEVHKIEIFNGQSSKVLTGPASTNETTKISIANLKVALGIRS